MSSAYKLVCVACEVYAIRGTNAFEYNAMDNSVGDYVGQLSADGFAIDTAAPELKEPPVSSLRAAAREQAAAARAAAKTAAAERAAAKARAEAAAHSRKICALVEKERITNQEAEAVLAHFAPAGGFQKDTRLALQVINRYAAEAGIRVEDAMTILQEYAA